VATPKTLGKMFSLRIPKELWFFIKSQSLVQDKPMNKIIMDELEKMKKKIENKMINKVDKE